MVKSVSYLFYRLMTGGAEIGGLRIIPLIEESGVTVKRFVVRNSATMPKKPSGIKSIFSHIAQFRASDIVISSISYASFLGQFLKRSDQKHFVWLHNTNYTGIHKYIYYCLDRFFNVVFIADSGFTQCYWTPRLRSKIVCIPLFNTGCAGIQTRTIGKYDFDKVITVVRPVEQKGIERLIQAAKIMPKTTFKTFGISQSEMAKYGLIPENIDCTKYADSKEIYMEGSIFILLSRWEGLSIATLEAMQSGLMCICTAVGAIPDHLQHDNAFLIPNEDDQLVAQILKQKLKQIESSPVEYIDQFDQVRHKTLHGYSKTNVLAKINNILNDNTNF